MSKLNNETKFSGLGRETVINIVGTPLVKNQVNSCHGNHAFFHSAIEFICAGNFFCI